jgi:cation diffusion facilitator CzcD-associated flavoprotein CzcO
MRSGLYVAVLALATRALGAAIDRTPEVGVPETDYDAIIVGGGPSGLAALSGLARVRRNVLLIDSGEYRNAPTRHAHDVLGFDGKHDPRPSSYAPREDSCPC